MRNVRTSHTIPMPKGIGTLGLGTQNSKRIKQFPALLICLLLVSLAGAQDLATGQAAIDQAATDIGGYFESIKGVIFVIAGIIALLGGIRIFMKWNMGDTDVMSSAAGWFGSAIFLIVAVTVIESFFGVG